MRTFFFLTFTLLTTLGNALFAQKQTFDNFLSQLNETSIKHFSFHSLRYNFGFIDKKLYQVFLPYSQTNDSLSPYIYWGEGSYIKTKNQIIAFLPQNYTYKKNNFQKYFWNYNKISWFLVLYDFHGNILDYKKIATQNSIYNTDLNYFNYQLDSIHNAITITNYTINNEEFVLFYKDLSYTGTTTKYTILPSGKITQKKDPFSIKETKPYIQPPSFQFIELLTYFHSVPFTNSSFNYSLFSQNKSFKNYPLLLPKPHIYQLVPDSLHKNYYPLGVIWIPCASIETPKSYILFIKIIGEFPINIEEEAITKYCALFFDKNGQLNEVYTFLQHSTAIFDENNINKKLNNSIQKAFKHKLKKHF